MNEATGRTKQAATTDVRFSARDLGAIIVISSAVGLDISSLAVVNAALPDIGADLEMDQSTLQWVMTAYAVAFAGLLLFGGRLADVFNRRAVFQAGILLFAVGSLAAALAPGKGYMIVARAAQGAGAAVSVPSALTLLWAVYPEGALRNRALAIYTAVGGGSFSVGLVIGGVLTDLLGWRSVFVFTAAAGAAVVVIAQAVLPGSRSERHALDLPGALLSTAGLVLVVVGVNRGGEAGWTDVGTLTMLVGGFVMLAGFLAWERQAREPLLPAEITRSRSVQTAACTALVFYGVVVGLLFFAPLYMQNMLSYSPLQSGLALVPLSSAVIVSATGAGRLLNAGVSQRTLMAGGLALIGLGLVTFMRSPLDGVYLRDILPGLLLMGVGQGLSYAGLTAASLAGVDPGQHGVAGAFNVTAQQIGASIGTAALVVVAASATNDTSAAGILSGYHAAYLVAAVTAATGMSLVSLVARKPEEASALVEPTAVGD